LARIASSRPNSVSTPPGSRHTRQALVDVVLVDRLPNALEVHDGRRGGGGRAHRRPGSRPRRRAVLASEHRPQHLHLPDVGRGDLGWRIVTHHVWKLSVLLWAKDQRLRKRLREDGRGRLLDELHDDVGTWED